MLKYYLITLLSIFSSVLFAQVTQNNVQFIVSGAAPNIKINVYDSEGKFPIGGAVVKIKITDKDSVSIISDARGNIFYISVQ